MLAPSLRKARWHKSLRNAEHKNLVLWKSLTCIDLWLLCHRNLFFSKPLFYIMRCWYIGVSLLCSLCAWFREGEREKVLILYTLFVSESTLSSVHSGSPPSSAQEESAPSTSSPTHPSLSPGAKSFYPRQGATSKYLIGWKKPGGTINSVDFGSSRK